MIHNFTMLSEGYQAYSIKCLINKMFLLPELNRSYEMSSFVETGATAILKESPVEFVKYPFTAIFLKRLIL